MKTVPVIRASLLQPFEEFLNKSGISVERAYLAAGMPGEVREDPHLIIPERPLWRLLEHLRQKELLPDAGFRIGAQTHLFELPGLHEQLNSARNLLELLHDYMRATEDFANTRTYSLNAGREYFRFSRNPSPIDCGQWPMEQIVLYSMVDLVRLALGPDWWPERIDLVYDGQIGPDERGWLQGSRVRKGRKKTAIGILPGQLSMPVNLQPTSTGLTRLASMPQSVGDSLAALLRNYASDPKLNLGTVCEVLGVPTRSLQRWLADEGRSFQGIVDEVRFDLARDLLDSGELPVAEVAVGTGYASPAAFSRAFSKWSGLPPSRFGEPHEASKL